MISYDRNMWLFLYKRQLIVKVINVSALIKISHYKTDRRINLLTPNVNYS